MLPDDSKSSFEARSCMIKVEDDVIGFFSANILFIDKSDLVLLHEKQNLAALAKEEAKKSLL